MSTEDLGVADEQTSMQAIRIPASLELDLSGLARGIDNYHIDVRISPGFTADLNKLIPQLISQADTTAEPGSRAAMGRRFDRFKAVQNSYRDMLVLLIHRNKTGLSFEEIYVLQFAVIKHTLQLIRNHVDKHVEAVKVRAAELRSKGSPDTMSVNERLFWLQKNAGRIHFTVSRQVFKQLRRVETRQLRETRAQYLPPGEHHPQDILFNPMLFAGDLSTSALLIEHYRLWTDGAIAGSEDDAAGESGDRNGFNGLNAALEELFSAQWPALGTIPMKSRESGRVTTELYDDLGGLFQTQPFMGPALDVRTHIHENFCWMDAEENMEVLFNLEHRAERLAEIRVEKGYRASWAARNVYRQRERALAKATALLRRRKLLTQLIASHKVRELWTPQLADQIKPRILCQYLCGQISKKKLQARVLNNRPFSSEQLKQLKRMLNEIRKLAEKHGERSTASILADLSRYRRHLKYFRFAHRVFNRVRILNRKDDLALSRQAGTLYTVLKTSEAQDGSPRIAHHSVLKADVRGSMIVTDALESQGLNPASYFGLRFFSPINEILSLYGAEKVFIEGDALILSFLEREDSPQEWFAVARACGLARAMLDIIHANNRHSHQMGLPPLEVGVGISYSTVSPRYLYDDRKPIMISSAIGQADRLSSSSWKLKDRIKPELFSVEVFNTPENGEITDEKGQNQVQHNVNGILLNEAAFIKLGSEITLTRLVVKIEDENVVLYAGRYPDTQGNAKELVIRQGAVREWTEGLSTTTPSAHRASPHQCFYEVVTNRKLIRGVFEKSNLSPDSAKLAKV